MRTSTKSHCKAWGDKAQREQSFWCMIMFAIAEGSGMHINESEGCGERSSRRDDLFRQTSAHLCP